MPFLKKLAYKVLNKKTEEEKLMIKLKILKELLELKQKQEAENLTDHACNLAEEFYVDEMIVSGKDGKVIVSTSKADGFEKMVKATSLFEFINTEFPDTRMLLIKDKDKYNVLYSDGKYLYYFKTSGEVSSLETKRIAEKIAEKIRSE